MFNYFKVYSWNLALSMALDAGANMDEIDRACRHLLHVEDDQAHANDFFHAWEEAATQLIASAQVDELRGRRLSAAEKYRRACVMLITAERIPSHHYPPRLAAYDLLLKTFENFLNSSGANCVTVSVPYGNSFLPALMVSVGDSQNPTPCMVHFNGLDGVKEYLYLCGLPQLLAQRGISILIVDNPGVGQALRKNGLHNAPDAEVPASACLDYLMSRPDIDGQKIGMMALSLGGYHAPRAAAFEPRFACCVVWGANYNWGKRFRDRISGSSAAQKSVPHYIEHVQWVLGKSTVEECTNVTDKFTLEGVLERIRVPVYITHGEDDRQISVADAHRTYEECSNSPNKELRIFSSKEGGEQHCSIGNMSLATTAMADWISDVLSNGK